MHKSGQVRLDFYHADAPAETIPALPIPRKPDPAAVVVGRIEAGQPWVIRLRDTRLFNAGATGPGKAVPRRPPAGQLPAARTGIVECPGRAYQGRVHAHAVGRAEHAAMPPSATSLRAC